MTTPAQTTYARRLPRGTTPTGEPPAGIRAWADDLRVWYLAHARGLLGHEHALLDPGHDPPAPNLEIGVVGLAGVGKSSLLNALIAPGTQVLPAGGVGPLTSTPVRIVRAAEPSLTVRYRDRVWLHEVIGALEGDRAASRDEIGQLSCICTGDQHHVREVPWLLAAIKHALRPDLHRSPTDDPALLDRLRALRTALQHSGTVETWDALGDEAQLFRRIHDHTAGQLAPLCNAVSVAWPSDFALPRGTIIDLPGLGSAHDIHARQTIQWLTRARAVTVVVDRAGLPEAVIAALTASGFLERWAAGAAELGVAITKIDLVADDERRQRPGRTWAMHYFDACQRATSELRRQLLGILAMASHPEIAPGGLGRITIVPVSSRERHRLHVQDELDRPRLKSPASTGIPDLQRMLRAMARLDQPLARAIDVAVRTIRAGTLRAELRDSWTQFLERSE